MGKLLYLEGIRGLAALWVFFIHYFPVVSPGLLDFFMLWQPRGWSVHMFFVLSGRVLTAAILKRNDSKRIASAFIRRPFRLALPVIGVILTNMVLFPIATLFGRDLSSKYNEIYTGFKK
jgi:peptidoglycan/LPS O-acetylase OafA/YrhL